MPKGSCNFAASLIGYDTALAGAAAPAARRSLLAGAHRCWGLADLAPTSGRRGRRLPASSSTARCCNRGRWHRSMRLDRGALLARGSTRCRSSSIRLKEAVAADLIRSLMPRRRPRHHLELHRLCHFAAGSGHFRDTLRRRRSSGTAGGAVQRVWKRNGRPACAACPRAILPCRWRSPELDGRIITRAISWKSAARYDEATQCTIVAPRAGRRPHRLHLRILPPIG